MIDQRMPSGPADFSLKLFLRRDLLGFRLDSNQPLVKLVERLSSINHNNKCTHLFLKTLL